MATKKISLGLDADDFTVEKMTETLPLKEINSAKNIDDFAIAALESIDWNAIGTSPDEAAQLAWRMAEAMIRNRP